MRLGIWLMAAFGAILVAGCNILDPFPTAASAPEPGQPGGQRVAICYNRLTTSLAEVQQQAQRQCAPHTKAQPVDTDWYLQTCPVLLPARASFACVAHQ